MRGGFNHGWHAKIAVGESLNPRAAGVVWEELGMPVPARGKGTDAHRAPLHLDENL